MTPEDDRGRTDRSGVVHIVGGLILIILGLWAMFGIFGGRYTQTVIQQTTVAPPSSN